MQLILLTLSLLLSINSFALVPHTFSANEKIEASKINENFEKSSPKINYSSCSTQTVINSISPASTCLSVSVTPKSTSSKLLIQGTAFVRVDGNGTIKELILHMFKIENSIETEIGNGIAFFEGNDNNISLPFSVVHEPNTTASVTYELRISSPNSQFVRLNPTVDNDWQPNQRSFMNIIEGH